ncbi:hypothetical protein DERP_014340 [Dermatophagoides pteronyssinus]|uniref:Carboxypeptidase n=1 Tax=Dermatophagoides pteronyssinus TaxID=6956 RepID=A0ABQ8JWU5_DERPT|nr:hypothetical protein DERP_014340 [Dermatophagoides pteronyssinus]
MNFVIILSLIFLFSFRETASLLIENPDEVKNLPGLKDKINFRHYSGYLEAEDGAFLHYWLYESQRNPKTDPIEASSLLGALTENGPFRIDSNEMIIMNNFSWNAQANMVYIESPAGVGYSYKLDNNYTTNDDITAQNNYVALKSFFKKFPHFEENSLYISGESYGGVYVPTLSVKILENHYPKNFKGFLIGNGIMNYEMQKNSLIHYYYHHALINDDTWQYLLNNCCPNVTNARQCDFANNDNSKCNNEIEKIKNFVYGNFDPYNIYHWMCFDPINDQGSFLDETIGEVDWITTIRRKNLQNSKCNDVKFAAPTVDYAAFKRYLNRPATREALHISSHAKSQWELNIINYTTIYQDMTSQVKELIDAGLKGLIYNGDFDTVCNYLGDRWFVESLGYKADTEYLPWKYNNQIGGFRQRYGKLIYQTIMGSGHMAPMDQPGPSQAMFNEFLTT